MKISKLFAITLQSKTRLIFFLIAATYNVILGLYLKDFLVLSPAYRTFYLLSVLPTLFLLADVRSKAMRSAIFVMISLSFLLGGAYALSCRRMIVFPATVSLALVVIYFGAFVDIGVHQDGLVHISQMTDRYIKHPLEVVSVGDIIDVQVMSVDLNKKRIQLTMKIDHNK